SGEERRFDRSHWRARAPPDSVLRTQFIALLAQRIQRNLRVLRGRRMVQHSAHGSKQSQITGSENTGKTAARCPAFRRSTLYRGLENRNTADGPLSEFSGFPLLLRGGKPERLPGAIPLALHPLLRTGSPAGSPSARGPSFIHE